MDPNAALRRIADADRVDAETREIMRGLHQWLSRGGFQPDWDAYPTGTRRYRKVYGGAKKARAHATRKASDPATSTVKLKLKDRYSGAHVWLTVRDGTVVGVMGSDPKRYLGMPLDQAKHVARYGGTGGPGTKFSVRRDHAIKKSGTPRGHAVARTHRQRRYSGRRHRPAIGHLQQEPLRRRQHPGAADLHAVDQRKRCAGNHHIPVGQHAEEGQLTWR